MNDELNGLLSSLNSKTNVVHEHVIAQIDGLNDELNGKANIVYENGISQYKFVMFLYRIANYDLRVVAFMANLD